MSEEDPRTSQPIFIKYEHSDGLFGVQGFGFCNSEKC